MIKLLHLLAITGLIGSAAYAYSIKYETLYQAEELAKVKGQVERERDAIAVAKAEWALLTRPDRLQRMAEQHLPDLQPMSVSQLGRISDLPVRPPKSDAIGSKLLEALVRDPGAAPAKDKKPGEVRSAAKGDGGGMRIEDLFRAPPSAPKEKRPLEVRSPTTTGSIPKALFQ